jgi:hypothetical protein
MKKLFTSTLVISSMILAPALKADSVGSVVEENPQHMEQSQEFEADEGSPVSQASDEGNRASKSRRWQNIALATAAVIVAVTALLLVANNDGHKK